MRTRLHRALSWLGRAEHEKDDDDARFLFLWVAFNAAYGLELRERSDETMSERALFVAKGSIEVGDRTFHEGQMIVLEPGAEPTVK